MELSKEINFLTKPEIKIEKLKYLTKGKINIYVNLYEIILSKDLKLSQYPFSITPEPDESDPKLMKYIYNGFFKQARTIFKNFFINNKILYSPKTITEINNLKSLVFYKNKTEEYIIQFQKGKNQKIIKKDDIYKDSLAKQYIELIIKECLYSNTKLDFFKDIFVMKNEKVTINVSGVKVDFYPGFTTSFVETEKGNFLNVTLKNKIIQQKTVLEYLIENDYKKKEKKEEIKEKLKNSIFKDTYLGKNHKIIDIDFDINPINKSCNYKGQTITIFDYYKKKYNITIKNKDQPLILVCKGPIQEDKNKLYFVPELCVLVGLEEKQIQNGKFMNELSDGKTKLNPNERVKKINKFLEILEDTEKKPNQLSPKDILNKYEIQIKPVKEDSFNGYYMKTPKLYDFKENVIEKNVFPVVKKVHLTEWYCVYEKGKENYKNADKFYKAFCSSSKGFGIKIEEPIWIDVPVNSKAKEWIKKVEEFSDDIDEKTLVLFLVNDENIYAAIKRHSLCKNAYISQVVKNSTVKKKGLMSICSKILLQINSKLGGISYKLKFDDYISNMNLMAVGVDSSHIKGKRTGVGLVATLDENFCKFYNEEKIIEEKNKKELDFCVSSFIKDAIREYKKENNNKKELKGIVIYRQGVSLHQKEFLKKEIKEIDTVCQENKVLYYYILVNTKSNYKIFHIENDKYYNPYSGLLVLNGIINRNFFEFYIQPQEVNEGSCTPTCFHVAYGNLDFPEFIPKFTFDLCHIYSNWKGPVRIPNVIKAAEKLSKMTAKYTLGELNPKLKYGQPYL